jgi:peptidoglycan/xylan/chitin deacetylase (PgdA/CDA1 family)
MKPHRVPGWVQRLFPQRKWEGIVENKQVYLTFDDGPVPGITDFVLDELAKRGQQATFFMVGDNVRKHASLAQEVLQAGHQIGNHTYNHLHGLKTSSKAYLENVNLCDQIFEEKLGVSTPLFRPPYGMMNPWQAGILQKEKEIVMWTLLTGDYDRSVSPQVVLNDSRKMTSERSIIVFHDQQKTDGHLQKILPEYLDFLVGEGFMTGVL